MFGFYFTLIENDGDNMRKNAIVSPSTCIRDHSKIYFNFQCNKRSHSSQVHSIAYVQNLLCLVNPVQNFE